MSGPTPSNGIIESSTQGRALVLCFDGTSGIYDDHNTNVIKLVSFLEKDSPAQQVYYQVRLFVHPHLAPISGYRRSSV